VTSVTGTWPIISSGGNTPVLSFDGLSTSSISVLGNIPYFTGVKTFGNVATTTATCTGNATCNPFTIIGSSPITISASGGGGGGGNVSTSSVPVVGQLAYWTTTTATPALLATVGTSSETCTSPLSCTAFNVVGSGGALSLGTVGIANGGTGLTTIGASSTVLISNSTNAFWQKLATSQLTNDSGFVTSSGVTSVATNNGLTGGTITTTGTLGLNITGLSTNAPITWNGSNLVATGTPTFTVGSLIGTTTATSTLVGGLAANIFNATSVTASSTFANGINLTNGCYAIAGVCLSTSGGGGAVSSVSNSDSTLTVSPTTGSVVASLNLSHANTWSAKQTFSTSNISITGGSNTNLLSTDGSGNLSWTAAGAGSNYFTNSGNNTYLNTGINLEMPFFTATSTTASSSIVTALGIGTTSPWTAFTVASGAILNTETQPATTTSMTVDFRASTNQLIRYSTSAMTITLAGGAVGQHLTLTTCNASTGTGGAITFAGSVSFSGGVQPGNSTQANTCDVWSWLVSQATSTTKYLLIGQTAGLQ